RKFCQKFFPLLSSIGSLEFKDCNIATDQPVAQCEGHVDGFGGLSLQLRMRIGNGTNKRLEARDLQAHALPSVSTRICPSNPSVSFSSASMSARISSSVRSGCGL